VIASDPTDTPSRSDEHQPVQQDLSYSKLTPAQLDEVMARFYQRLANIAVSKQWKEWQYGQSDSANY